MKDILFLTGVHGDEVKTIAVMEKLDKENSRDKYDWIIANPEAVKLKKRFLDVDLNRSAPGNANSEKLEERLAKEIIDLSRNYRFLIDLHTAQSKLGLIVIVTKKTEANLLLASILPIKTVLIWEGHSQTGPLSEFVSCGLEIECGNEASPKTVEILYNTVKKIIEKELVLPGEISQDKDFFEIYGHIASNKINNNLVDFKETTIDGETFIPLFVNEYPEILCYKSRLITLDLN